MGCKRRKRKQKSKNGRKKRERRTVEVNLTPAVLRRYMQIITRRK